MDRLFKSRVDMHTAREVFLEVVQPLYGTESVPIEAADNRVLAADVVSEQNVPHYRRSAMDGFAVRAEDTLGASLASPVLLRLSAGDVIPSTCRKVHTGSALPGGADAVVMLEDSRLMNSAVEITAQVHPYKHVSEIGEDVEAGEKLFESGHQLRPFDLAVLGSIGITDVEVFHRPLIAIIPTGEEVVPRGTLLKPGEIWETNSLMTASYVRKLGAVPRISHIVTDDYDLLRQAILAHTDADMLIISGGTSVGERDLVPSVIEDIGEVLVHGIAISPGKPTALGIVGQKPVLCMPGYPVAGLIALLAFGKDVIQKLGHIPRKPETVIRLPLKAKIASRQGYHTYVRVRITDNEVEPLMTSGAGILSSVARADGYIVVPPNIEGYGAGTNVDVHVF